MTGSKPVAGEAVDAGADLSDPHTTTQHNYSKSALASINPRKYRKYRKLSNGPLRLCAAQHLPTYELAAANALLSLVMAAARKLTEEAHASIVDALRAGNYVEDAVAAAGLHKATYYRWIEQGEADLEHDKDTAQARLCDAVRQASAASEVEYLTIIREAGERGQWRAAAWFLEHRYPDKWGPRSKGQEGRRDRKDLDRQLDALTDQQLDELSRDQLVDRARDLLGELDTGAEAA